MAKNAPFCTENVKTFLRPAARTMRTMHYFCTATFQIKVMPLRPLLSSFCAGRVFIQTVWSEKQKICINSICTGHDAYL